MPERRVTGPVQADLALIERKLRDMEPGSVSLSASRICLEAADMLARVGALLPAEQPSLAHSSESDEMRADADPPLGLEHRLRIAADGVWFNSADHNAPHGIHSLRALYREAADALQAATQERDRQKEVIDSAMGPTWAQFDALYDVIESLTAGLREIKERSKCVIGNAVLSKHDGRFCAYHAAQAALATTTATAVVSEDEDDEWKLTFEKATPLHIGPCPRCVVLEAALRETQPLLHAVALLADDPVRVHELIAANERALAAVGAGGTDNSPEQGSEARPAETAGARGGSRCECDELGRGPDDECIYTNPCEIVVRPPRDRGGKQS